MQKLANILNFNYYFESFESLVVKRVANIFEFSLSILKH
jgi:hypothetical protein